MEAQPQSVGIESTVSFSNSQGARISGTLVHITRTTIVFETYNPYSIVQLSEMLHDLTVMRGSRQIYKGRASVTGLVPTGLMVIVSATLLDTWSDFSGLEIGEKLTEEAERFIQDWENSRSIRESYQVMVSSMSNFLGELSTWLEEAEAGALDNPVKPGEEEENAFLKNVIGPLAEKIGYFFSRFEKEAREVPHEETMTHKAFARSELHPLILCDPFSHRTFSKPLGYAGDFDMVNMMLHESEETGTSIYAKIINALTTNVAAAEAHRNRIEILEKVITEEARRVNEEEQRLFTAFNLGCGPAVEVQRFIRNYEAADACSFMLLDFNQVTLDYTKLRIDQAIADSGRKPHISFILKSVDALLREVAEEQEIEGPVPDFVYCAGLFDYFPDHVCRYLVEILYNRVKPGGKLMVTNVHPNNPNRYGMEHLLEWYLVYRNEEDMLMLAPDGTKPVAKTDPTGMNVFLEIEKEG